MQYLMAFGIPAIPALFGFVLSVIKAGAPWHRHYWEV